MGAPHPFKFLPAVEPTKSLFFQAAERVYHTAALWSSLFLLCRRIFLLCTTVFLVDICLDDTCEGGTGTIDGAKKGGKQNLTAGQITESLDFLGGELSAVKNTRLVGGLLAGLSEGVDSLGSGANVAVTHHISGLALEGSADVGQTGLGDSLGQSLLHITLLFRFHSRKQYLKLT